MQAKKNLLDNMMSKQTYHACRRPHTYQNHKNPRALTTYEMSIKTSQNPAL